MKNDFLMTEKINQIMSKLDLVINLITKSKPEKEQPEKTANTKKQVHFYRYIRPVDPETGDAESQRGVTFSIMLDYTKRAIKLKYSICNQQNGEPSFNYELGRNLADKRKAITIPMWEPAGKLLDTDITEYILDYISQNKSLIPERDLYLIFQQANDSERW